MTAHGGEKKGEQQAPGVARERAPTCKYLEEDDHLLILKFAVGGHLHPEHDGSLALPLRWPTRVYPTCK